MKSAPHALPLLRHLIRFTTSSIEKSALRHSSGGVGSWALASAGARGAVLGAQERFLKWVANRPNASFS